MNVLMKKRPYYVADKRLPFADAAKGMRYLQIVIRYGDRRSFLHEKSQ